jgi:2'-5' RNA ligase
MKLSLAINASKFNFDEQKFKKLKINLNKSEVIHQWVAANFFHIDLLSLGEMDNKNIYELDAKIKSIIQAHGIFELKLSGVSVYPNQKEGRLLWIGVQNSIPLRSLQADLARNLINENSYQPDKLFRPILPIIRLKNYQNVTDMISPYNGVDFGKLKVEQLALYEMISGGAFPVYKLLKSYPLNSSQKKTSDLSL